MSLPAPLPFWLLDLKKILEQSPFTEEFEVINEDESGWIIDDRDPENLLIEYEYAVGKNFISYNGSGNIILKGLFDESVEWDAAKQSTVSKRRIKVFGLPTNSIGLKIIVRGENYTIRKRDIDKNEGIIVWLN